MRFDVVRELVGSSSAYSEAGISILDCMRWWQWVGQECRKVSEDKDKEREREKKVYLDVWGDS